MCFCRFSNSFDHISYNNINEIDRKSLNQVNFLVYHTDSPQFRYLSPIFCFKFIVSISRLRWFAWAFISIYPQIRYRITGSCLFRYKWLNTYKHVFFAKCNVCRVCLWPMYVTWRENVCGKLFFWDSHKMGLFWDFSYIPNVKRTRGYGTHEKEDRWT